MNSDRSFQDLIRRLQEGDPAAQGRILRSYQRILKLYIRSRLTDPRVRKAADSSDICQLVWASLFLGIRDGRLSLDGQGRLHRLLQEMARNKVLHAARAVRALRRGGGLASVPLIDEMTDVRGRDPAVVAELRDLFVTFRLRLTQSERALFDGRFSRGLGWEEIARETGQSVDAAKKCLSRGLLRVAEQSGLIGAAGRRTGE